ncbi:PHP domain-containing protein [Nonomuraea longicatena]|uniref:Histidinol-phosphatase n=2 Tax=Nonomuraea longicatena TaxID=83682 RepID=A0ABP4AQY0_9ACTN
MEGACARAVALGLPAIAFTEHVDHTVWTVASGDLDPGGFLAGLSAPDGSLTPPGFDAQGYLEAIERCRERFPSLRILSGLELGEPHWHAEAITKVLGTGRFDRVLGSLHCLPEGAGFAEPPGLFEHRDAGEVVRGYLEEVARLIAGSEAFSVLAHIDYPVRHWPRERAGVFDYSAFEEEFRHALRVTAQSGRALELNTRLPMHATLVRWWHEEGGQAVTFGSDAHGPADIARRFREAAHMAEAHGFRPGRNPYDLWARVD